MVAGKLALVPRYRQKVRFVPLGLGRPVWVDDPHFSLSYHLRHIALPAPGDDEQIQSMAARVFAQHLDRNKPLWEIWMVEGLSGGRWALLSKVHHCMVDGVAATDLMSVMFDEGAPAASDDSWVPAPEPSGAELIAPHAHAQDVRPGGAAAQHPSGDQGAARHARAGSGADWRASPPQRASCDPPGALR